MYHVNKPQFVMYINHIIQVFFMRTILYFIFLINFSCQCFKQICKKDLCTDGVLFASILTNTIVIACTRRHKWQMKTNSMLFLLVGDWVCTQFGLNTKLKLLVTKGTFTNHTKPIMRLYQPRSCMILDEKNLKHLLKHPCLKRLIKL